MKKAIKWSNWWIQELLHNFELRTAAAVFCRRSGNQFCLSQIKLVKLLLLLCRSWAGSNCFLNLVISRLAQNDEEVDRLDPKSSKRTKLATGGHPIRTGIVYFERSRQKADWFLQNLLKFNVRNFAACIEITCKLQCWLQALLECPAQTDQRCQPASEIKRQMVAKCCRSLKQGASDKHILQNGKSVTHVQP